MNILFIMASSSIASLQEGKWPDDVGIVALEVYFPSQCVDHTHLETFDGVSTGKYTIGLGQENMGFCTDREDIHSLALTVVHNIMENNNIAYTDIGRLEVGTETILDKSKSVKTVLMQLFKASGNTSMEGLDTTNACFGGTQALFNAISWVESSSWDGRYALVVTGDIAVYACGNARPTGGAGAVAMLIGPNAPLVMERGQKAIYMEHAYDFYKPNLSSEYPIVDGKLSINCYLNALDQCYKNYGMKYTKRTGQPFDIDQGDFYIFHSPFTRLVQKSLARLVLHDYFNGISKTNGFESLKGRTLNDTLGDKDVEKLSLKVSEEHYKSKTEPSVLLGKKVGNMYTASLYGGLASLMARKKTSELAGKRVVLFSYGSGLASSMYSFTFTSDTSPTSPLHTLMFNVQDVTGRLESRQKVPPAEFERIMKLREETHHKAPYTPVGDTSNMFPGTYYLQSIDEKHRRSYERKPKKQVVTQNLTNGQ